jgi:hypothetical protein
LEELKGFTSSKSAFMTATKELSEAAVFTGIDAYSNIGVLINEFSQETSQEMFVPKVSAGVSVYGGNTIWILSGMRAASVCWSLVVP